jgi:hypothetical protein
MNADAEEARALHANPICFNLPAGISLRKASMRFSNLVGLTAGCVLALAAGNAGAASVLIQYSEYSGPSVPAGPYPQPAVEIGTKTFAIPPGEVVVAATISGFWGASPPGDPNSTAGVNVMLDGIVVAKCVKPDPSCWSGSVGQRPWSYTLTSTELKKLDDGAATLTFVQTSESSVNLGVTTLRVETGARTSPSIVPATSPAGLAALLVAMSIAAGLALRRRARG